MIPRLHTAHDVARAEAKDGAHDGRAIASIGGNDDWCEGSIESIGSECASECSSMVLSNDVLIEDAMFDDEDQEEGKGVEISPITEFQKFYASCEIPAQTGRDGCTMRELVFENTPTISFYPTRKRHSMPKLLNPLSLLPDELLCEIFTYLAVDNLLSVRHVSRRLKHQASKDQSGWLQHLSCLWKDKVFISKRAEEESNAMEAYRISFQEGNRQEVTAKELCFDPRAGAGTVWYFRFKESAGSAWTSSDPWHAGLECRRMVFLSSGTIKELIIDQSPPHAFRIAHPFSDVPNHQGVHLHDVGGDTPITMKWRFLSAPMDMPSRPLGAYIRLNVAGRDVPTYIAQRSPTNNWGFILENCWGVFASFPLPLKSYTPVPSLRPTRIRLRRINGGGVRWINADGMDGESDDSDGMEVDTDRSTCDGYILADSALPTTSRRQWREALLYNYGSITLPEGEAARAEFDRIFASFLSPIQSLDNMLR